MCAHSLGLNYFAAVVCVVMAVPVGAPSVCGVGACGGAVRGPEFNSKHSLWVCGCVSHLQAILLCSGMISLARCYPCCFNYRAVCTVRPFEVADFYTTAGTKRASHHCAV